MFDLILKNGTLVNEVKFLNQILRLKEIELKKLQHQLTQSLKMLLI